MLAILTAAIMAGGLLSACSSQDGAGANNSSYELSSSQVKASAWQSFFDGDADGAKAIVATQERVWDGARKAVEQGAALFIDEVPEGAKDIDVAEQLDGAAEETAPEKGINAAIAALEPKNPKYRDLTVVVTENTAPEQVATARAAGAEIEVLPVADPRASHAVMTGKKVVALGDEFGDQSHFDELLSIAGKEELPGGGGLVFPGRRMVALYGHPSGPALGAMGEQPPAEAVARVQELAAQYQPLEDQPVIPAFEVIATVASGSAGADGNYSNESDVAELRPYIEAIGQAGGYAVIDLQPGTGNFLQQAKLYEELLRLPYVGLALDPEWKLNPGEKPLSRVGSATAEEINEVSEWLAQFVRENELPQKAFVLHQFQVAMIEDRENLDTAHPELAFVLHADGHGDPGQKFDTWNVLRQDLSPDFFMAWKNFYDEDTPTFSPEQTYTEVDPRPWFVSYQ
ncbi:cell wall-binding repeat-containing protein [Corynebacterium sp. sy039]|uniref:cell wall-binding repeat-containing protein n=1 Tax=Corynebacterium sp. sy039 TaxID=2599641 RepID=UPI0011B5E077|nr:cell wall-binding repeat-containing protein [Corynebacterium sp. sy039]QDZ43449.1 cell wall-binding repeat-containing protein [Corynebacterium sp. sy039]